MATLGPLPLGMAASAAGGNINPTVGGQLAGAHGQQLAAAEMAKRSRRSVRES